MRALVGWCLRRPVAVTAWSLLAVGLAVIAYVRLPVALLPDLRYPALAVWTAYPDVPPERVERAVTERVEAAVAGVEGVVAVTGRSLLGGSLVVLRFGWNTDLNLALLNVREQLDQLGDALPDEAERPVVLRLDPSDRPIMLLALRQALPRDTVRRAAAGESFQDLVALKRLARDVVARRLEQLEGVARVRVTGGYEPEVEVRLDPERLIRYGLTVAQIEQRLRAANVTLPGGLIRRGPFRYAVEVSGAFTEPADVAETIVGYAGRTPLRLADVAEVRPGVAERRGLVRFDGEEALLLLVERAADANTVVAARQVRRTLRELEAEVPGVRLDVVVDESLFIRQAIAGVQQAVLLGGVLALVVLLVFLRRPRVLLAVAVAVPLSLALTLIAFEVADITLNLLSLSGLALGVGMLVDNAIVVTENIARLREQGYAPLDAAREGTVEVAAAITASTLTTIAVFGPLAFVEGLAGRLFRDQALAVVFSLLASLLVALTVVPVLAARDRRPGRLEPFGTRWLLVHYEALLRRALRRRGLVVLLTLGALAGTAVLAWHLPRQVMPHADLKRLTVHLSAPPGTDLPQLSRWAEQIEAEALRLPTVQHVLADLGERDEARLDLDPRPPYEGTLTLLLDEKVRSETVAEQLRRMPMPPALTVEILPERTQLEALLARGEADLWLDLQADLRTEAEAAADQILPQLRREPALVNVRRAFAEEVPGYALHFRRDVMARFGVDARQLADWLAAAARGLEATALQTVNEAIPIRLRLPEAQALQRLLQTEIPTAQGLKPIGLFVEARPVSLPASLLRAGQAPVVRLLADVAPGADLAAARAALTRALEALPPGVRGTIGGATDAFREGLRGAAWSLLLSLLLVFLILAAQFESLRQPFIILFTVPLATIGVTLTLALTGQSVNLMSLTGLVVLVGIVVNDAIIKVDFINRRRAEGMPLLEAIEAAGRDRLRPILMTTVTTVLGLLPLALGLGAGAALQQPLAITIIGGLTSATLLTLIVVPVLYVLVAGSERRTL
ncbi:efflux RND transporter permease subunit [Rhodothermus marinus]|uniref:efflux RND transporter permease subunit n=2 Tax=Rhodothermus marinus TaxID=29549 RepID=UPI0012BA396C|nr:efflux RND transporter permease subunit [Rhodothermus marinus]BBM68829.1 acriflavin resistance protein [Rhodothermus marinus]BBM71808.1 acriflavin resistance protein [Rhodothermus marinus]